MLQFRIDDEYQQVRLDKFLRAHLPAVPASHVFKLIRVKKVKVNGKRGQPEQLLQAGDVVTVRGDEAALTGPAPKDAAPRPPPKLDLSLLQVVHQDEWMLVLDKPSGLAVHPGSGIKGGTVVDLVRAMLGPRAERNGFLPSPAHRLDRETSGLLIVACRRPAMVHFTRVFTEHLARKRYLALVKGALPRATGLIDLPLQEHQQTAESRRRRGINLQPALTRYRRLASTSAVTLVSCTIETGRTHQIRRHFAAIGHPVVGDPKHGDFAFNRQARASWGLDRLFLHATELTVPHPQDQRPVHLTAPLPEELLDVARRCGLDVSSL